MDGQMHGSVRGLSGPIRSP